MSNDLTRYQILFLGADDKKYKTENFTAEEKVKMQDRYKELKKLGVNCKVWDCLNNSLSRAFDRVFK